MVRDWMGITGEVKRPAREHPKRKIQGFECPRSEVSGSRLWGWARDRFRTTEKFFERFFVWNYCPLCFMSETGANVTPDKLRAAESKKLFAVCDDALRAIVDELDPRFLIGVGKFAEDRIRSAVDTNGRGVGRILHPSPASPAANRDWAGTTEKNLRAIGVHL